MPNEPKPDFDYKIDFEKIPDRHFREVYIIERENPKQGDVPGRPCTCDECEAALAKAKNQRRKEFH